MAGQTTKNLILAGKVVLIVEIAAIVGAAGYMLGRRDPSVEIDATTEPPAETQNNVALHVYVAPEGAYLTIDGARLPDPVGDFGVYVPVVPRSRVKLRVDRPGYIPEERVVLAPPAGKETVTFTLSRRSEAPQDGRKNKEREEPLASARPPVVRQPTSARPPEPEAGNDDDASNRRAALSAAPANNGRARRNARRRVREEPGERAQAAASNNLQATPRPPPPPKPSTATLLVRFEPKDAQITIDGRRIEGASPIMIKDLAPGSHVVRVESEGYEAVARTIPLAAGDRLMLPVTLQKVAPPPPPPPPPPTLAEAPTTPPPTEVARVNPSPAVSPPPAAAVQPPPPKPNTSSGVSPLFEGLGMLLKRKGGPLRVTIVYAPGADPSAAQRRLTAEGRRSGYTVRATSALFRSAPKLLADLNQAKAEVIYLDRSMNPVPRGVMQVSQSRNLLTVGARSSMVRSGISLARSGRSSGPKLMLNRRALAAEGFSLSPQLRRLATVVD